MANYGDEKDCGGYTRRYHDSQWDLIISNRGIYYWRDKYNHITYKCKEGYIDLLSTNQLGNIVDQFNDEEEDEIWD